MPSRLGERTHGLAHGGAGRVAPAGRSVEHTDHAAWLAGQAASRLVEKR